MSFDHLNLENAKLTELSHHPDFYKILLECVSSRYQESQDSLLIEEFKKELVDHLHEISELSEEEIIANIQKEYKRKYRKGSPKLKDEDVEKCWGFRLEFKGDDLKRSHGINLDTGSTFDLLSPEDQKEFKSRSRIFTYPSLFLDSVVERNKNIITDSELNFNESAQPGNLIKMIKSFEAPNKHVLQLICYVLSLNIFLLSFVKSETILSEKENPYIIIRKEKEEFKSLGYDMESKIQTIFYPSVDQEIINRVKEFIRVGKSKNQLNDLKLKNMTEMDKLTFPYWHYTLPSFEEMYKNLKVKNMSFYKNILQRRYPEDYISADGITNTIEELDHQRMTAEFNGFPSPMNVFEEMKENMSKKERLAFLSLSNYDQRDKVYNEAKGKEANNFNPALGIYILRYFGGQGSRIYDPSSGWGDRAVASVRSGCDSYTGFDPNLKLKEGYEKLKAKLLKTAEELNIRDGYIPPTIDFLQDEPLSFIDRNIPESEKKDIVITSPPYYNLEVYSNDPTQSIHGMESYEEWIFKFYQPYLTRAYSTLRQGGHFIAYVENTWKIKLEDDTKKIMKELGAIESDKFGLQVSSEWNKKPKVRPAHTWFRPISAVPYSPETQITAVKYKNKTFNVVREDRLPLGTKGRYFPEVPKDKTTILYTGSCLGYGPVVAAALAKNKGLKCVLVLDLHHPGCRKTLKPYQAERIPPIRIAKSFGAKIELVRDWGELVSRGKEIATEDSVYWCPLGFLVEEYISGLAEEIHQHFVIPSELKEKNIWVVGGSGVIALALSRAVPDQEIHVVPLNEKTKGKLAKAFNAFEHYDNLVIEDPPTIHGDLGTYPIPFVPNYDTKVWDSAVLEGKASDGDIIWNVANGGDWFIS